MLKVIITAPRGTMDSLIVQEAYKHADIEVVGCVGTPGRDYIGNDAGLVAGVGKEIGALVYEDLEDLTDDGTPLIETCDVVIDYSAIELSMAVLDKCVEYHKAYLCGTTGFSEEQLQAFAKASQVIPIMQTANTSYVVTVMKKLLAEKNLEKYRIVVHALKSTSLNIGAAKLSEQAKAHEFAARDGELDFVESDFDSLLENYKAVMNEASALLEKLMS